MEISDDLRSWLRSERLDRDLYRDRRCVYTLVSVHGPVKIGISKDVFRRIKDINTSSFVKARLFSIHPTDRAPEVERLAHARLAEYRLDGEWFDVLPAHAEREVLNCEHHIDLGLDLADYEPSDFSRFWYAAAIAEGDGGLATVIEPCRDWEARRDRSIARYFDLTERGAL